MKIHVIKADSRGHQYHGWLDAHHTFSFADYYNPERIHFGALRVLNDDVVAPGKGFGMHPHDNMEIITIPLYGKLQHQDNMGNERVMSTGEVQVMSAGTGVMHSEFNASDDELVNLFQLWIFPDVHNVDPRYDQRKFDFDVKINSQTLIVGPKGTTGCLWINQKSWLSIGTLTQGGHITYTPYLYGNGLFAMVIEGEVIIGEEKLLKRDAVEITDFKEFNVESLADNTRVLFIEVPMRF